MFETTIFPQLTTVINGVKRENAPDWFDRHFEGKPVLDIVFVGFDNDVPVLRLRSFIAETRPSNGLVYLHTDRSDAPSRDFLILLSSPLGATKL
jgi:hypothetical protein